MTLSRGNGHGRVDGAVVGDVGGLAAQDGADDADEVIGDVIEDELLGFPFGHFAFEIVTKKRVCECGRIARQDGVVFRMVLGPKWRERSGLKNARPTAFLERGNAEVGRPNFGVVGLVEFLKGDEAVRGQEQANARNGEQKEERLMQVGVLSKEPLDLPVPAE